MSTSGPTQLTLTCRLCKIRAMFPVLEGIRADMTEEDARADVMGRIIRAEDSFFRNHWQQEHPDEAAEVTRHIVTVARLARVSVYSKVVLDRQFEDTPA